VVGITEELGVAVGRCFGVAFGSSKLESCRVTHVQSLIKIVCVRINVAPDSSLLAMPLGRCITNVQVILILSNTELSFALAAAL
jgi:hypothetical protein